MPAVLLAIFCYNLVLLSALVLLSPVWAVWLLKVPKIRAGFWEKSGFFRTEVLKALFQLPLDDRVWLHAVSVGEVNAAMPLIQSLRGAGYPVVLSTTTLTGQNLARQTYPDLPVCYFPFDLPEPVHNALGRIRPALVLVMETEIWPNFLFQASRWNIPVMMVNGRLSERSFGGYARFKWFFAPLLNLYTRLLSQGEGDAQRIHALGAPADKVLAAGNLKFDMPTLDTAAQQAELKALFAFPESAPVVVFASTHKGEEEQMMAIYHTLRQAFPTLHAVLAPRHPERAEEVCDVLTRLGVSFQRRSQMTPHQPGLPPDVVLLDTIGELNAVFAMSSVACMGGTFVPWGGHNPLEPINAQIPVVFGPSMENFRDITEKVLSAQAGFQAQTPAEAAQQIETLLLEPERYQRTVAAGQALISENRGAVQRVMAEVCRLLPLPGTLP